MSNCEICNKENPEHLSRCEKHFICDKCGTKENQIICKDLLCYDCRKEDITKQVTEFIGDTRLEPDVVCPYCGYRHQDSHEMGEGENDCGNCEKTFDIERIVDVSYTTTKIDEQMLIIPAPHAHTYAASPCFNCFVHVRGPKNIAK